ncbi:MAG: pyridoxamine 5'-phosphate oxidase family protein [Myxococcota bacterium]
MQLTDAQVDGALATWPVARLALADGTGQPRVLPVVFVEVSGTLWSPVDGKPTRGGPGEPARVRHVRAHPLVELVIDGYDDDWSRLWWIRIDGIARVVQPPDPETDPDVAPVLAALRRKYPQYERTPLLGDPPTLLAIRPDRVRSWRAGPQAGAALDADA